MFDTYYQSNLKWHISQLDDVRRMVEDLHQGSGSGPIYSIQKTFILFPSTNAFAWGA